MLKQWGRRLDPRPPDDWEDWADVEDLDPWTKNHHLPFSIVEPAGEERVRYNPLENGRSLFQEFANTSQTPEGVLSFANRYGLLKPSMNPENLDYWYHQINQMRNAVDVWQRDREKDLSNFVNNFSPSFSLRDNVKVFYDKLIPASILLQETEDPTRPRLKIEPEDLLATMWLELALAVEGSSNYRPCDVCPTWFEVAPGSGREDKKFCSDACKMRAYRKRKSTKKSN